MTSQAEETAAVQANIEKPKPRTKARVAPKGAHVAAKRAESAKKGATGKKSAKRSGVAGTARDGSKTARVLAVLRRAEGASLKELLKTTGWQAHSVRGFLSGTIAKKMGLTVTSAKSADGERTYSIQG